ncbi:Got1/Sft2-like vescicle transport protein family [Euphorbia peplus]|nr:Got1/Sft2-like vescicle transport protein family [Euphorbia peplus]
MWKLNQLISGGGGGGGDDGDSGENLLDDESEGLLSLSPMQSMYAFAACFLAGVICMFLSFIVFVKPIKFAILFTFGNVLAVGSTAFLIGPAKQLQMMFDAARIYATSIYLGFVVLSLICALLIHSKILTIIAVFCEICALIWYSLSYIPFARRMVSNLMVRLFDTELD